MNTKQLEQLLLTAYPFASKSITNYPIAQYFISLVLLPVRIYIIFTTGNVYNDYGSPSNRAEMLRAIDMELFLQMKNGDIQDGINRNIDYRNWYRVIEFNSNDIGAGIRDINKAIFEIESYPEALYRDLDKNNQVTDEPLEGEVLSSTTTDHQEEIAPLLLTDNRPNTLKDIKLESGDTLTLTLVTDEDGNTSLSVEFITPVATTTGGTVDHTIPPTTPEAPVEPPAAQKKAKQTRMTKNRRMMLDILTEIDGENQDCAPYNAESIEFFMEEKCGKENINIGQINRTLRDLVKLGLVVYELRVIKYNGTLPKKVRFYQAVEDTDRRRMYKETIKVIAEAHKSRGTMELFTGPTEPFSEDKVGLLLKRIGKLVEELTEANTDEYRSWVEELLTMREYALSDRDGVAEWHIRNALAQKMFA